jgi:pimeloyl-ACP methyl ester carboxylesterase
LGADEKAFSQLAIDGYEFVFIPWLMPVKSEPIAKYAARMAHSIPDKDPVLIGLSFGGMMSIEIARLIPVAKIILISSIQTYRQLPLWMRFAGKLKVNKLIPLRPYKFIEPIQNKRLGVTTAAERELVNQYRKITPQVYLDWAINEIINWKNDWKPATLFHIHGDADKIFPIDKISATHIIKNAGHFMIMNKATEVNECLKFILAV